MKPLLFLLTSLFSLAMTCAASVPADADSKSGQGINEAGLRKKISFGGFSVQLQSGMTDCSKSWPTHLWGKTIHVSFDDPNCKLKYHQASIIIDTDDNSLKESDLATFGRNWCAGPISFDGNFKFGALPMWECVSLDNDDVQDGIRYTTFGTLRPIEGKPEEKWRIYILHIIGPPDAHHALRQKAKLMAASARFFTPTDAVPNDDLQ